MSKLDLDFEILEKKEMPINLFPKFFHIFFFSTMVKLWKIGVVYIKEIF